MPRLEDIIETYAWYQGVGNQVQTDELARTVRNPDHPDIWVANHLSSVRAQSADEIHQVLARGEQALAHCQHRMVIVDPLTPAAFVARLALDDYVELTPTLQMVLEGPLQTPSPGARSQTAIQAEIRPVVSDADWDTLAPLVRSNHLEGHSSHHLELDEEVTRHMVAGYRAKSDVAQFFLAYCEGAAAAYGSAIIGPHGIGIVEDLFTAPTHRSRGLATQLIAHAVGYARERSIGPILIGPHVTEPPKGLYAALGFVPQCVTRQYILDHD